MSVEDRELFLSAFLPNPTKTTIGLLILGGAFSEGIDLADDRLIGVGIVGVGIPQVNHENNLIRAYREEQGESGYDFAYKFPGINKVTQAVGRLIRSETDVGAALLIDDRYLHRDYRDQFARIWPDYEVVLKPEEVTDVLSSFYKKDKD
jgi:Rad3-related DNA helicase